MFVDCSNVFDSLNHDLGIPKLGPDYIDKDTFNYRESYVTKRKKQNLIM